MNGCLRFAPSSHVRQDIARNHPSKYKNKHRNSSSHTFKLKKYSFLFKNITDNRMSQMREKQNAASLLINIQVYLILRFSTLIDRCCHWKV